MKCHRNSSVNGMFDGVPHFMEIWHTYIYGFSDNAIVAATVLSCRLSSNFWKRWDFILFTASDSYQ